MWVSITQEHDGDKIGISANVTRESWDHFHVVEFKFSKRASEMDVYFARHPSRADNIRADLIAKAIRSGE